METPIYMDKQTNTQGNRTRVTAVVSAYNEAPRIGKVLEVLASYPGFQEIIVVDDGSTDGTGNVAKQFGVHLVRNDTKMGKGYAMDRGVALAQSEIIFFSDADIIGLTHETIDLILAPVLASEADMFIGMSDRKWYLVHEMVAFVPLLGGERAITKSLWQKVPEYYKQHFRIEVALNFFSIYYGKGYRYAVLSGVGQTVKEEKYGFWQGLVARVKMYYNVFSAQIRLNIRHTPRVVREGRGLGLLALYGAVGTVLGLIVFIAIYFGPVEFVRYLFAEKLRDPTAYLAHTLFDFARFTATDHLALIGLLIFISSICIFILTRKNLGYLLYSFLYKFKNSRKR
ncbi:MAG: glycosyltransferase [bacterium]|nr:glycosyltransferase [bacterium]